VIFGTVKFLLFGLIWIEPLCKQPSIESIVFALMIHPIGLIGGLLSVLLSRNGRRTILPSIM
jgi:hypothetical protein